MLESLGAYWDDLGKCGRGGSCYDEPGSEWERGVASRVPQPAGTAPLTLGVLSLTCLA